MKIKRLVIENFKSIERIELIEPNPFAVFVGPNGSGKSNIFEALEFVNRCVKVSPNEAVREFGGIANIQNRNGADLAQFLFGVSFNDNEDEVKFAYDKLIDSIRKDNTFVVAKAPSSGYEQFYLHFSRVFVGNNKVPKFNYQDDRSLNFSASNLEKVLKRVLTNPILRDEIFEWLELFVPGFKAVEIDDRDELHWFEDSTPEYFTKELISDGTYNILALLTAVYQSDDKPQFLCIEEPENGLHPQVAGELVDFFRIMCEERGHYIWLNTHSQSMASRVRPEEFVVVEKKQGATTVRQFEEGDFHGMRADEAWLTNALNGGLAW
ncbi:AAA family ATPase [Spirosoma spitsbergense]|uniref:AAA family ATPase n=1 Tax=Spirosoma spitsbergense TaxID=431554 RepID=UPI000361B6CD|nr:ATP-binding protein [Spirosoma spitsbergense]